MKKLLATAMIFMSSFGLVGCNNSTEKPTKEVTKTTIVSPRKVCAIVFDDNIRPTVAEQATKATYYVFSLAVRAPIRYSKDDVKAVEDKVKYKITKAVYDKDLDEYKCYAVISVSTKDALNTPTIRTLINQAGVDPDKVFKQFKDDKIYFITTYDAKDMGSGLYSADNIDIKVAKDGMEKKISKILG